MENGGGGQGQRRRAAVPQHGRSEAESLEARSYNPAAVGHGVGGGGTGGEQSPARGVAGCETPLRGAAENARLFARLQRGGLPPRLLTKKPCPKPLGRAGGCPVRDYHGGKCPWG